MDSKTIEIFKILVGNGSLGGILDNLSMPNIPFPTLGGTVFGDNIVEENGWKIQRDTFTGHYRILNPDNIRRAWGSEKEMERLFSKFAK